MIIRIESDSEIPIYLQISNQIIDGIARGNIQSGQSLPSVRNFAADLGINMHTVNKSYHYLEQKGIIQIVPKSGAIISSPQDFNENVHIKLKDEYIHLIAESIVTGMTTLQIKELVATVIEEFKKSNKEIN